MTAYRNNPPFHTWAESCEARTGGHCKRQMNRACREISEDDCRATINPYTSPCEGCPAKPLQYVCEEDRCPRVDEYRAEGKK